MSIFVGFFFYKRHVDLRIFVSLSLQRFYFPITLRRCFNKLNNRLPTTPAPPAALWLGRDGEGWAGGGSAGDLPTMTCQCLIMVWTRARVHLCVCLCVWKMIRNRRRKLKSVSSSSTSSSSSSSSSFPLDAVSHENVCFWSWCCWSCCCCCWGGKCAKSVAAPRSSLQFSLHFKRAQRWTDGSPSWYLAAYGRLEALRRGDSCSFTPCAAQTVSLQLRRKGEIK